MSRYWLMVLLQLVFATILVYVGWEAIILVIEPKGSNWMWVTEMNIFFVGLGLMIVCPSIVMSWLGVSPQRIQIVYLIQVTLLIIWYFSGRNIFPFRYLYLLLCGLISVSIPVILIYFPIDGNWNIKK